MPTTTTHEMLTITSVQVYPVNNPTGRIVAYARVLLNDQLQLTALRLYDGVNGLFVSYPSDAATPDRQVMYPVTRELQAAIEDAVIAEYRVALAQ